MNIEKTMKEFEFVVKKSPALEELLNNLNEDLKREYSHWHFYLYASYSVTGAHREEYQEYFKKEAASEMEHILEFSNLIQGFQVKPTTEIAPSVANFKEEFLENTVENLILYSLRLENEVVNNYAERLHQAGLLEQDPEMRAHAMYIKIFLEDQMMDSRKAVDNLRMMIS